jgi:RHS repeat-associated protein
MRNVTSWTNYAPGSEPSLFVAARGFTGHEHLPWFNLINMNGRIYDPLVGQFLSPDNHVQAPFFTQSLNRYVYCLNNPLRYTDPTGEKLKWWQLGLLDILTGGVVSITATSLITTEAPTWTANAAGLTFINSFSGQDRIDNTWDIWKGLFKTNPKLSKEDQVLQWISRFTLQAPQTQAGYTASQGRNLFGGVDDVEFFDGATLVNRNNPKARGGGMTLSPYILGTNLTASIYNKTFMHEYGHTLQSAKWGPYYLPIPALFSGIDELTGGENTWSTDSKYVWHDIRWYERQANKYASNYFKSNYGIEWDEEHYPIWVPPTKYRHPDRPSTLTIKKY